MITAEALGAALAEVVARGDFTVPPYPAVAVRLQRLLARESYGVSEVAETIAADAALAATVLATANSAVHGSGVPITSLSRAVNRLGARTVGAIAVASGISQSAVATGVLLDVKFRVWRRTMTCALVSQKLASARGLAPEEAFLSGLLHGFGRSIAVASLEQVLKTHHTAWPLSAEEWIAIAEQQRAPLARTVAQRWKLPEVLTRAIENEKRGTSPLSDLVLDADLIAQEIERGQMPTPRSPVEARLIEELMVGLPGALESFMSQGTEKGRKAESPFMARVEHALKGELFPAHLSVMECAAKKGSSLSCIAVAPSGIEIHSSKRFQECSIARLTIGEGTFQPWFTVVLCVPEGTAHRVELQLFSPTGETREQWREIYSVAESAALVPLARAAGSGPHK